MLINIVRGREPQDGEGRLLLAPSSLTLLHPTDRRQMVVGELIETEKRYITNLETLLNVFLPSLELLVAPRDLRLMFPAQLEPLLEAHRRLVRRRSWGLCPGATSEGVISGGYTLTSFPGLPIQVAKGEARERGFHEHK